MWWIELADGCVQSWSAILVVSRGLLISGVAWSAILVVSILLAPLPQT
jgi:hypothetical protein